MRIRSGRMGHKNILTLETPDEASTRMLLTPLAVAFEFNSHGAKS